MKRIISVICLLCLVLSLAACGNKAISADKAKKIVAKDLGVSVSDVQMDLHVGSHEGKPCFAVYVTYNGENFEYLIDSNSGEILAINENDHGHSH